MAKVITVQGCKDCPCLQFNRELEEFYCHKNGALKFGIHPPTFYPNECPLNDIPNARVIEFEAYKEQTNIKMANGFIEGANYIIKEITK